MTTHSEDSPVELAAESLLHSFMTAEDADAAQAFLDRLFEDHAQPLIGHVVHLKMYSFDFVRDNAADQKDICQEVAVQLLTRLREIRSNPGLPPIDNFHSYVAASAQNACYRHVRLKRPARWRFKNRVRYILNHKPQFAAWYDQSEQMVCGLAAWAGAISRSPAVSPQVDLGLFLPKRGTTPDTAGGLVELIEDFLHWCGGPVDLDSLVGALAEICGVREVQYVEAYGEPDVSIEEVLPDPSPDPARQLEQKLYLKRLWHEIQELPLNQRLALLLNMRDGTNSEATILFTHSGTATLREIAGILDIGFEDFLELWNRLPLDDNTIAARLGLTRQQVINLRKSARERLARRMRVSQGQP